MYISDVNNQNIIDKNHKHHCESDSGTISHVYLPKAETETVSHVIASQNHDIGFRSFTTNSSNNFLTFLKR